MFFILLIVFFTLSVLLFNYNRNLKALLLDEKTVRIEFSELCAKRFNLIVNLMKQIQAEHRYEDSVFQDIILLRTLSNYSEKKQDFDNQKQTEFKISLLFMDESTLKNHLQEWISTQSLEEIISSAVNEICEITKKIDATSKSIARIEQKKEQLLSHKLGRLALKIQQ